MLWWRHDVELSANNLQWKATMAAVLAAGQLLHVACSCASHTLSVQVFV
jgi:hypothetical protein